MNSKENKLSCLLHGSLRKNFDLISEVRRLFTNAGIEVLAPEISALAGETGGFVHLASDTSKDPRVTELLYLKKLSELGPTGFSYYINPQGTIGVSASYELAMDQLTNTRYLFMNPLKDHPAYIPQNSIWKPKELIAYITENKQPPPPIIPKKEKRIQSLLQELILPGSLVAVGGIIIDYSSKRYKKGQERDTLLVRTHKWGNRFSIVGGKVQRNERLSDALQREVQEETGLSTNVAESICTFDELKGSGYFIPGAHRIFTDNVVQAERRRVNLNEEAEEYTWMPPSVALRDLDIEPNAKKTLELYVEKHLRIEG